MSAETRVQPPDVHSSQLLSLARVAMAESIGPDGLWQWPALDFSDPAQRRFGDYELLAEIGRGGMGVVYRARQLSLEREVALKFIAAGLSDTHQVTRFIGEARAAARLVHPNIVPVYEVGSVDEIHYFSMPLIEGESLAARLDRGPLAIPELLRLLLRVCEAVDYAHRLGLLHLDLKPANVLIDARGEPLIADFGLARRMDESGAVQAQEVSGTPAFMAPEQILIRQYRLTAATDLYALGAMLYRCLTGQSPHGAGSSDELIRRALVGRVQPVRELAPAVPPDLAAVCGKCLELEPRARYPGVRALIDDLRRIESGLPVSVRRPGLVERAQRWLRREPKLAVAAGVAFAAIALGGAIAVGQWREAESARARAVAERDAADAARAAEAAERQRAEDAAALGAMLYGRKGSSSNEVVKWLQNRAPGEERRQAEILGGFALALRANGLGVVLDDLLYAVLEQQGAGYRRNVVAALTRLGMPDALIQAAMLTLHDDSVANREQAIGALLDRSLQAAPGNAFGWYVAMVYCVGEQPEACPADAAARLTEVDAENGYAWLLLATTRTGDAAYAALHQAARSPRFDDFIATTYEAYARGFEESGVAPPQLVAGPARVFAPDSRVERVIAQVQSMAMPLPALQNFVNLCRPEVLTKRDTSTRSDCIDTGIHLARMAGGLVGNMVGAAVVRRLAKGTPLEAEMKALRARYVYLSEVYQSLPSGQRLSYGPDRMQRDIREVGELGAYARVAAHFGKPIEPPADWVPKDPQALLLPEERTPK